MVIVPFSIRLVLKIESCPSNSTLIWLNLFVYATEHIINDPSNLVIILRTVRRAQ